MYEYLFICIISSTSCDCFCCVNLVSLFYKLNFLVTALFICCTYISCVLFFLKILFIYFFFKFLLLFNYSCMPFIPIPPPQPYFLCSYSASHEGYIGVQDRHNNSLRCLNLVGQEVGLLLTNKFIHCHKCYMRKNT